MPPGFTGCDGYPEQADRGLSTAPPKLGCLSFLCSCTSVSFFAGTGRALPAQQLVDRLRAQGVLVLAVGPDTIRAVTNLMVSSDDIRAATAIIAGAMK